MMITHLELRDFRGYEKLSLDLEDGLTAIAGPNASGKSNLVEAIHYLSLARSWRTPDDKDLIRDGCDSASIKATVKEGGLIRKIEIEIGKGKKKVLLNGKPVRRLSELARLTNVIVFAPSDVALFTSSPSERRNFLDVSLGKKSSDYFSLISKYGKLLKERNALLKRENPDLRLIEVLTEQMVEVSLPLVRYRRLYVDEINKILPSIVETVRGEPCKAKIHYRPFIKDGDGFIEAARKTYQDSLQSDLIHKSTSVGPHREDFSFKLNGKDISTHGSQGENRIAVFALKMCPYFLIEDKDRKPICVLDDVASELDETKVKNTLNFAKTLSQTFVTSTKLEIDGAAHIDVSANNAIIRR